MRETPKAFAAFAAYCALGTHRSLRDLANNSGTKLAQLGVWSSAHNWQERVKTYDLALIEEKRRKADEERDKMNERHALIATIQQKRAIEQIDRLIKIGKFGSQASVQLLKVATDLERLARGAPTERTEVTGKDGGPIQTEGLVIDTRDLSDEELALLKTIALAKKEREA